MLGPRCPLLIFGDIFMLIQLPKDKMTVSMELFSQKYACILCTCNNIVLYALVYLGGKNALKASEKPVEMPLLAVLVATGAQSGQTEKEKEEDIDLSVIRIVHDIY